MAMWLAAPGVAPAQTILEAGYDPEADALVLEIAYRGTRPDHRFRLEWDACRKGSDGHSTIAARLVDENGDDTAHNDYEVTRRFALSALDCRPAEVTVRLGPVSNRTVFVPERPR